MRSRGWILTGIRRRPSWQHCGPVTGGPSLFPTANRRRPFDEQVNKIIHIRITSAVVVVEDLRFLVCGQSFFLHIYLFFAYVTYFSARCDRHLRENTRRYRVVIIVVEALLTVPTMLPGGPANIIY